ncbi:MAG TPA: CHC2 zinc finger domain-containing protein [Ktedonobacteraceae bacterium]|jgi:DNA primase
MKSKVPSIAEIKARLRIEKVIRERGIALQTTYQGSKRLTGNCPFHQEETPSFNVYIGTQRFQCFGCGAHGDVIDFVERFDQCSRQEAMKRLSEVSHVLPVPRQQDLFPLQRTSTTTQSHVTMTERQKDQAKGLTAIISDCTSQV